MLVLTRKEREQIYLGDAITLVVLHCTSGRVTLGFDAPPDIHILRAELWGEPSDATTDLQHPVSLPRK